MNCPIDNTTLAITERQGVEIDYCPQCRGVWLDRGELDKMIEKSAAPAERYEAPRQERQEYHDDRRYQEQPKKKKRESFLSDLFEF